VPQPATASSLRELGYRDPWQYNSQCSRENEMSRCSYLKKDNSQDQSQPQVETKIKPLP